MQEQKDRSFSEIAQLFFETRQLIRSKLPHSSVDPNEWMRCETMRFIYTQKPSPTMREIAEHLRITAPSATSIVRRLQREGFVLREREYTDKRVVHIVLSKKGQKRVNKYLTDASNTMQKVFSKISDADITALTRILRSLQEAHRG